MRDSKRLHTGEWSAPITEDYTDELNDFDVRRLEALRAYRHKGKIMENTNIVTTEQQAPTTISASNVLLTFRHWSVNSFR